MMDDIFVEQIIKKKMGLKDYTAFLAVALMSVFVVFLTLKIPALFMIAFLIWIALFFADYYLITSRNVEFEYSVTNGDITIDKIISRRKRKHVLSVDAHNISEMGKFKPDVINRKRVFKPYFTSIYDDGRDSWYFCAHSSKNGNVLVVFNPEEKVLNAIRPFLPGQVALVAFGRN
ncbi:MAG TPA: hypothetical protein DG942_04945 [Ruminococcaceae bacterium]|jgi:hypothetical protein|nr:hypothetical protein [Oscillospiraceae bacterium]